MNARIIELLQQPSLMQANDLQLLEKQIEHTPYVQNVRALYLYGIHLYNPTRYKEVLTTTAAYTTDKKILYQFINKKDIAESSKVESEEKTDTIVESPVEETQNLVSTKIDENLTENKEESSEVEAEQEEDVMNVEEGSKDVIITDETPTSEKETEVDSDLSLESIDENLIQNKEESSEVEAQQEEDVMNVEEGSKDVVITDETPTSEKEEEVESDLSLESIDENLIQNKEESSEVEAQQEEDVMNVEEGSKDVVITDETPTLEKETEVESDLSLESIDENLIQNKEESSEVEAQQEEDVMNVEEGSKDVVITDETEPSEIKEELNRDVSFESIDDFLPQVKFEVPKNHHQFLNPPKFEVKEHKPVEIEEKPTGIVIDDTSENIDSKEELNDAHSLDFGPFSREEESVEVLENEKSEIPTEERKEQEPTIVDVAKEEPVQENSAWKPMSIDAHQPDALIGKVETPNIVTATEKDNKPEPSKEEVSETVNPEIKLEESVEEPKTAIEIVEQKEENLIETSEKIEEEKRPIFNVSFFGDSIAMVDDQKKANEEVVEEVVEEAQQKEVEIPVVAAQEDIKPEKSNVRQFINTWQNWLKIDRTAEIEKDKEVKKQKAIDEFIENQPKITQLKDEASFVVKEKKEDISHLMTETLANLYLEQKLYSKAIKAFETLIAKHPEKTDYFTQKIEDIKEQRKA
ncbi:hypothetical protein SAMN05660477_01186 [Soonwooa buanensis]|uniref:Tetratricopeptide repeat-containing protein n=1 Tax=Soonwooa buanensis TaxID=619805 RepID=A0A1T5E8Q1_9FLAO|nr:hypothetical protein [Soonwooa buanensis]SKB80169.1 hypothetical protein SAMN05660477_01186 [Soonwooa buanensis]